MKMKEIGVDESKIDKLAQLGIPRDDAVLSLKSCNGQLERAAEYFLSGECERGKESAKWSEEVWSAPREGPSLPPGSDNNFSQFHVQSPDALAPNAFAPESRPPSRTSNRERIDLTGDDNDPELARALAASLQDSSGNQSGTFYSQQESGITGTHTSPTNPNFSRVAPEREYDPRQWAVTTTQAHEIFLDPSPADRKRLPGEPAFLRPANSAGYLPALLTILHSIPLAREGLLIREHVRSDYGHDDQWWNGQQIKMLRVINVDDDDDDDDDDDGESQMPEEIVEAQRLMAFLDQTTRAYGSVEGLPTVQRIQDYPQHVTPASFLESWESAAEGVVAKAGNGGHHLNLFSSKATQRSREAATLGKGIEMEDNHQIFQVLDVVGRPDSTFYDAIDKILWACGDDHEVFVDFADIFCVSVKPDESGISRRGCGLEIPTIFYPDRYTEAWIEPVREIRNQIEEKRCLIDDIDVKEEKLRKFRPSKVGGRNPPMYEPKMLLESVIEHLSTPQQSTTPCVNGESEGISTECQKNISVEPQQDITMEPQNDAIIESESQTPDIIHMLKSILLQLERKLSDLSVQKEETRETFKKLKTAFTSPETSDPAMPALTKYSLRGFCADSTAVYVLIPFTEPLETSADNASSSSTNTPIDQWWCLNWGPAQTLTSGWDDTPTASYEVKKVTEEEVLEAIKTTGDGSLLLVYASDNALKPKGGIDVSLPVPLQTFVDRDNAAFKAELQPTSPGRKRHNNWLEDDDEAVDMNSYSPNKMSSSRSSATLGNTTPQLSRRNSFEGTEMEVTEGVDPTAWSISGETMSGQIGGGNLIGTVELAPPRQEEMVERGHISPVAKAFHMDPKGKEKDIDQEMMDVEHVENTGTAFGGIEEN